MMTDAMTWLDERVPRGSLIRFSIAGGFNSIVFYLIWVLLLAMFAGGDVRLLWAACWGTTSVLAHYVHRWFTFDDRKPVSWTLSTAVPVYFISLGGSTLTIGWLSDSFSGDVRVLGMVNLVAWGVMLWLLLRLLVFQYSPTAHASQEHPGE